MKKASSTTILFSFLLFIVSVITTGAARAQSFDMSTLDEAATQPPVQAQPQAQPVVLNVANGSSPPTVTGGAMTGTAQFVPGAYNQQNLNGAIINVLGNITNATGTNAPALPGAKMNLLAPGSGMFNGLGDAPSIYRGVTGFQFGGILPSARFAPIDANVVE